MTADTALSPDDMVAQQRLGAASPPLIGGVTIRSSPLGLAFQGTRVYATVTLNGDPQLLTYNWFVDGKLVSSGSDGYGVPDSNFIPVEANVGHQLSVTVTAIDSNGGVTSVASNALPVINVNDLPIGNVSIDAGPQTAGSTLHASSNFLDADGIGTLSYQWKADGQAIDGVNGAYLTLTAQQAGKAITVVASYIDGHGHPESLASDAVAQPGHVNTLGTVAVAGTLAAGKTLRADVIDPDGTDAIYYQWQAGDGSGNWTDLAGATARSVTLGDTAPALMRVLINYADFQGNVEYKSVIVGTDQGDIIKFAYNNQTVLAGGGNDTIYYTGGSNTVDGGAGLDTFVTPYALYSNVLSRSSTPHLWSLSTITGQGSYLINVERVKFSDVSVALDTDGVAGQAFRLYQAAFNRVPDKVGVGFWISQLDNGMRLSTVADAFVHSDEFTTLYGSNPSNADLVTQFYQNILHREPEAGGFQFWVDVLDRHAVTVAGVLLNFSDSPENVVALVGAMSKGVEYVPYG